MKKRSLKKIAWFGGEAIYRRITFLSIVLLNKMVPEFLIRRHNYGRNVTASVLTHYMRTTQNSSLKLARRYTYIQQQQQDVPDTHINNSKLRGLHADPPHPPTSPAPFRFHRIMGSALLALAGTPYPLRNYRYYYCLSHWGLSAEPSPPPRPPSHAFSFFIA